MNETTQFLAQLMGPMLILLGISFGVKTKDYISWFKKLEDKKPYLFLQGMIEATIGLAIILSHNLWNTLPEIIISIFGWLFLLEGTIMLLTSNMSMRKYMREIATPANLKLFMLVGFIIGLYLTWTGYAI